MTIVLNKAKRTGLQLKLHKIVQLITFSSFIKKL